MKTRANTNNVKGLIQKLLETSSCGGSEYIISVLQVTMVGHNQYNVLFDCLPKEGVKLREVRRIALVDTHECRIPWSNIVNYDTAVEPALVEEQPNGLPASNYEIAQDCATALARISGVLSKEDRNPIVRAKLENLEEVLADLGETVEEN